MLHLITNKYNHQNENEAMRTLINDAPLSSRKKVTKRQLQAQASKEKIFRVSQDLFSKYGYNNVTIADICEAANVSVGLFYSYFKSKKSVPMEAFNVFEVKLDECVSQFSDKTPIQECFVKIAKVMLVDVFEDATQCQYARILYAAEVEGDIHYVFNKAKSLHTILLKIIGTGIKTGQLRANTDVNLIARLFFNYTIGSTIHMFSIPSENQKTFVEQCLKDIEFIVDCFAK